MSKKTEKPIFPYKGKALSKQQIEFFVAVCISAAVDMLSNNIPGRWMGDPDKEKEDTKEWKKAQKHQMRPKGQVGILISDVIWNLGWTLSIFYAQCSKHNDGMGEQEALDIANLGKTIQDWAHQWLNGEIGIVRSSKDAGIGNQQLPDIDELARRWTEKAMDFMAQDAKAGNARLWKV